MFDLSDWAWLIVIAVVFVFRAISRLVSRSRGDTTLPPKPERPPAPGETLEAPREPAPGRFEGGRVDRTGNVEPKPIEPK